MTIFKQLLLSAIVFILGFMLITIGLTSNEVVRAKFYGDFLNTNNIIEETLKGKENTLTDKQKDLKEKEENLLLLDSSIERVELVGEEYVITVGNSAWSLEKTDKGYLHIDSHITKSELENFAMGYTELEYTQVKKIEIYECKLKHSEVGNFHLDFIEPLENIVFKAEFNLDNNKIEFEDLEDNYTGFYSCMCYLNISEDNDKSCFTFSYYLTKTDLPQTQN